MKKIIAILLLLLILFQLVGFYSIHKLQVSQVKREIKKKIKNCISKEELFVFTFDLSETDKIRWVKKDKEFIFEKKLYDVVRIERIEKTISYYCIADFKETKLFAQLDDYVNNFMSSNPDQQKKTNRLFKRFNMEYFSIKNSLSISYYKKDEKIPPLFIDKNYTVFQMVESPPPKAS